jgi:Tol biopolymer transport system component
MAILRVGTDPFPAAAAASDGVVAVAQDSDNQDLWWVPLEGGPPVRITAGAGAAHPSVAGTGRIAFARRAVKSGLWRLPVDANTGRTTGELQRMGRQIASMNYPNLSRDGKMLVYVSNRSGSPDVWVRNLETGEDRQLTSNKADEFRASISPDGQHVAYTVNRDVVTLPVNGGVEKVICRACAPNVMMWSPDGKKLLVYWGRPIRHGTIDLATGKQEELVVHPTGNIHNGRYSPDGKWIMFTLVEEAARVIYVTSVENGKKPEAWIRLSGESVARSSFWSPDGNLVYIHQLGVLMARRLDAASKTPVGEAFVVQRLGPAFSPLFSANGMSTDSLYFLALETSSNIWIADPMGR